MGNIQYRYDTPTGYVRPVAIDYSNYYANGGPKRKHDQSYNTVLTPEQEVQYRQWVNTLPVYLRNDYDYDLRGAWLDGVEPDEQQHMPDTYKKPWHPTFSEESIYSSPQTQGGSWNGDTFTPSAFNGYMQGMSKYVNYGRNLFAKGGKKPDWDPENPYHVHTDDGQKVSFTPEAYTALPENIKRQVDKHAAAMNTFENQYMVNPEYEEFRKRMEAARTAENVAASRGEYWDRNWYDPNYKSGAYAFDDNGLMTYQGQTYAPFGDSSQQGIVVPMRTPNGMSYGANVAYYPVNVPQQYIERPVQEVNNTINEEQVKAALNKAYTNYIIKNTTKKVLYPRYGTDNYGSKHIQNIYNGDGKLKYNTPYVHKKDPEYYAVFVDDLDEEDRQRGLVGVDYYPMSTIGQYTNKPINVPGKYGLSVDISNIGTEDKTGALHPASSYTKELFPIQYIETKPSEEEAKRNVQVTVDDFSYLGNTFAKGGPIHIKPENRGKFSEAAKRAGYSTQAYARHIMANKENYSPTLRKRANFALNASRWHAYGGNLYANGGPDDPPVIKPVNLLGDMNVPLTRSQGNVMAADKTKTPAATQVSSEKAKREAQVKRENYMNSYSESKTAPIVYPSMKNIENAAVAETNANFVDNTRGEEGAQPAPPVSVIATGTGAAFSAPYFGTLLNLYGLGNGMMRFANAAARKESFISYIKSPQGLITMAEMAPGTRMLTRPYTRLAGIDQYNKLFNDMRKAHIENRAKFPDAYKTNRNEYLDYAEKPVVKFKNHDHFSDPDVVSFYEPKENAVYFRPRQRFRSDKVIKNRLAHEYEHLLQGSYKERLSTPTSAYFVPNKKHQDYNLVLSKFEKNPKASAWEKSPDELDAEMMKWKNAKGLMGKHFNTMNAKDQEWFVNKVSDRFGFSKKDSEYILKSLSARGYM